MRIEEYNLLHAGKGLRYGYTTGSCAAAAAKAAVMIWGGTEVEAVRVSTPSGVLLDIPTEEKERGEDYAVCAVRKYAGDDPDVTDKILIYARVEIKKRNAEFPLRISIDGGCGIGRVSKKGLDRKPGEAAINTVPRRMIEEHVREAAKQAGIFGDIAVTIYAPEGEEAAKKTLNKKLGILGGISILGTSGIVTPMSRQAIIDTIHVEMRIQAEKSPHIIAVPGNYGVDFTRKEYEIGEDNTVVFSNYIGETIDYAVKLGVESLLLIGHIGKFVKLAAGIMNTHSNEADARAEIMAAHFLRSKPSDIGEEEAYRIATAILHSNTTTESTEILKDKGVLYPVMHSLAQSMYGYAKARAKRELVMREKLKKGSSFENAVEEGELKIGIITYTLEEGELARAGFASEILEDYKKSRG